MLRMADRLPQEWEIDFEDLGNVYGRARIQRPWRIPSTSIPPASLTRRCGTITRPSSGSAGTAGARSPTWRYAQFGEGKKYSDNQGEDMVKETAVMRGFDRWTDAFAAFVAKKGKVPPGKYRAYGYEAPSHHLADLKLK